MNGEALWPAMRSDEVSDNLLNIIKNMYDNSYVYVRIKGVRGSGSEFVVV